jgi:uncharacterized protein YndB with AHSA1/START domain
MVSKGSITRKEIKMTTTVCSEQFIKSTPEKIYYALTHSIALHEWLCDYVTVAPRPGGRMYLWWHGDFYSSGEYISLVENRSIKFKWHGRFEPAASEVTVVLEPKSDGTQVTLSHTVPDGEDWIKRAEGFKNQWDSTLPNLASVIETGVDRRTFDRPLLGININEFNPEIARSIGVPVDQGIRLSDVLEGMGARAAGLRKDDVIVEFNGKAITNDFGSLVIALQGKKGGDKVEVTFYRGSQKMKVDMELSKRPVPEVFWDPLELSKKVRSRYDANLKQLHGCFKGFSETEAGKEPAPGDWSAKQTLAHLIQTERGLIAILDDSVGGYERFADDWGGNIPSHINATVAAYDSINGMLAELKRLSIEIVSFLAALPASFVERKASYFLFASQVLEYDSHTVSHIDQIKTALANARVEHN